MRSKVLWLLGVAVLIAATLWLEERRGLLTVGTAAPDFVGILSDGTRVLLSEYVDKKNVVLFFYPRDFTSGCTTQACSMRDRYDELSTLDAVVFGVSGDGCVSHEKFKSSYNLPFELIADTNRSIITAYGADWFDGFLKRTKRVTYVIDKKGIIRLVSAHEIRVTQHTEDILQALRSQK